MLLGSKSWGLNHKEVAQMKAYDSMKTTLGEVERSRQNIPWRRNNSGDEELMTYKSNILT